MPPFLIHCPAAGGIPNSRLPVVVWRGGVSGDAEAITAHFARHGWSNAWTDGVYGYHHFHSTAHEALGVSRGAAALRLGGPRGRRVMLRAGDALVIPAGVGHRREWASRDFEIVGAYPGGADYDIRRGDPAELPEVLAHIAAVPPPGRNPVDGGALPAWG